MSMFLVVMMVGVLVLALAAVPVVIAILRTGRRWSNDRSAPRLQAEARVVDKRAQLLGGNQARPDQLYFVTFQFADGNRVELRVPSGEAGLLVVGDEGHLAWQGARYQGFARTILR